MPTTTVYLPDDLKEALARAARTEGVSEADFVRRGVRELIEAYAGPRPILPLDDEHDHSDPMLAS